MDYSLDIKLRLKSLGYETTEADDFSLKYNQDEAIEYVKHFCNIDEVPTCLKHVIVDRACGGFLKEKQSLGEYSVETTPSKIQIGDTTIESNSQSQNTSKSIIDNLMTGHLDKLLAHRKLEW